MTTIRRLRTPAYNKSGLGGVLRTNDIHIATCDAGQVSATLAALRASPAKARAKARFILATDGETLEAEDLTSDDPPVACAYPDFHDHFGFFLPLAGITTVKQIRESTFDIKATDRLNRLYGELLKDNPGRDPRSHRASGGRRRGAALRRDGDAKRAARLLKYPARPRHLGPDILGAEWPGMGQDAGSDTAVGAAFAGAATPA